MEQCGPTRQGPETGAPRRHGLHQRETPQAGKWRQQLQRVNMLGQREHTGAEGGPVGGEASRGQNDPRRAAPETEAVTAEGGSDEATLEAVRAGFTPGLTLGGVAVRRTAKGTPARRVTANGGDDGHDAPPAERPGGWCRPQTVTAKPVAVAGRSGVNAAAKGRPRAEGRDGVEGAQGKRRQRETRAEANSRAAKMKEPAAAKEVWRKSGCGVVEVGGNDSSLSSFSRFDVSRWC